MTAKNKMYLIVLLFFVVLFFFCCCCCCFVVVVFFVCFFFIMSRGTTFPTRLHVFRSACASTQFDYALVTWLPTECPVKTLIGLCGKHKNNQYMTSYRRNEIRETTIKEMPRNGLLLDHWLPDPYIPVYEMHFESVQRHCCKMSAKQNGKQCRSR